MSVCYHLKIERINVNIFCTLSPVPSVIYGFSIMNPSLTTYITIYVLGCLSCLTFYYDSPLIHPSCWSPIHSCLQLNQLFLPCSPYQKCDCHPVLPVCSEQKLGSQSCFTFSLTYLYNKLLAFKSISYFESGKYIELYSCQKHFF